jgi:pilus assembly protein CpaC
MLKALSSMEIIRKAITIALVAALALPSAAPLQAQSMTVVDLNMTIGKSLVIDYPVEIGRISTSNPEVVDAVPATAKEFLLHGKGHGSATVVVWAKTGARTMYNVTVDHNLEPIRKLLSETFPNEDIRVQSARDSVTLIGTVSSKDVLDRAVAIATPLAKTVVTNVRISTAPVEQQIMLKVRFAELNRNKSAQFGLNLISTGIGNTPARITTGQFPAPQINSVSGVIPGQNQGSSTQFNITDALNIFAFRPDLNIGATLRALQNEDILQILAEPNLTTVNGKEASFLVGGEFPVPILQGGANAGAVTVQFREYGIRLTFNPLITGNGTIKMYVKPEVSTIDLANSVSLSGFTIPALATRRMETNVELKEGQSFMVAGLVDDRTTDQMSKIPGLASIPILGQIFKTRFDRKQKSELIVIVTPEIVKPLNPGEKMPLMPEFPKSFLEPYKISKTNLPSQLTPPPVPKADAAQDEAVKKAEAGAFKGMFFWRNKKAAVSTSPVVTTSTPASSEKDAATGVSASGKAGTAPEASPAPSASPIQVIETAPKAAPGIASRGPAKEPPGLSAIPDEPRTSGAAVGGNDIHPR